MLHRVAQFVSHVTARIDPHELALPRRVLTPDGVRIFEAMHVADRRHALDVAQRLLLAGNDDPDLLAAALLHDAAKGPRMRLWHRVGGVLLEAVSRRGVERLASSDPASARYGFHLYLHHGPMSAAAALAAGASPRTAEFIRGRARPEDEHLLAAFRAADEAS